MQKLRRSELKRIRRTSFYLEEFWEIARLFKDNCQSVEIVIDGFRLETASLEEVQELRERLRTSKTYSLHIKGRDPDIHLDLERFNNTIFIFDADDLRSAGLAAQLMRVLPFRFPYSLLSGYWLFIANLVNLIIVLINAQWVPPGTGHNVLATINFIIPGLIAVGIMFYFVPTPVLYLEKYAERRTFVALHKHDLIKGACLLALGSLLTFIVQYILKQVR